MNTYQLYSLTISTLSPLHIGSGVELLNEYDFAIHQGRTWRLNDTAILDSRMPENEAEIADRLAKIPPGNMLEDADFDIAKPFFRYVLNGEPRSEQESAKLREQIKDIDDNPYIPGSSFKGGLRTAIAWYGWGEKDMTPSLEDIYERNRKGEEKAISAKFVGQVYERPLFGKDPRNRGKDANYDLLRALQVADSKPATKDKLIVLNTQVFKHNGEPGTPIEIEAILPKTNFETTIKIDSVLFSEWAKESGLNLHNTEWVNGFARIANERSKARAQDELNWLGDLPGTKRIAAFYKKEILERTLKDGQFLLQFGWGTGWENMTFGSRLQMDEGFMEAIIDEYELSMNEDRQAGDLFPESRRMAVRVRQDENIELVYPLGWVLVEMKKVKHG